MAKLTDRQRNNILAKWHTGQYTKTALAKLYKVDEKVIRNITEGQQPKNSDIVEAQTQLELFKKSEISPIENAEINKSVEARLKAISDSDNLKLKIYETQMGVVDLIAEAVKKAKKQVPIKVKQYDSDGRVNGETVEIVEMDLESTDLKNYAESVDKASLTLKVNERHAPKVEVNNTNAQQTNLSIEDISRAIGDALPD